MTMSPMPHLSQPSTVRPGVRPAHGGIAILMGLAVAGCDFSATEPAAPVAPPAPIYTPPSPKPIPQSVRQARLRADRAERARRLNAAASVPASAPSNSMRSYLDGVEADLRSRGLMRTDGGGGIPFDAADLVRDFNVIALQDEYTPENNELVAQTRPSVLRRWEAPVSIRIEFGASVDQGARARIRAEITDIAARLRNATGHPVALTDSASANFDVLIMSEDERRASAARVMSLVPGIPATDVQAIMNLQPGNYCSVFAYSRGPSAVYDHAVAVLRAELPPLMMRSCIHEELAQGMGLVNDSPLARPSIFNDDEEFALLTPHDEMLLKMLYDPRLKPGMTPAEAAPIVQTIAAELKP
ncbi:DUF2927 domain-containing protein [Paracoccus pacificus]|uniref:DUF2927 domain-containing protein n=1 Tax=Paracoccus pacificus TaxID=1463598 RepID=A0ABW4RAZ5_9RHOB